MIYVGIDTGVHTGYAVYDSRIQQLTAVGTDKIHNVMQLVSGLNDVSKEKGDNIRVRVEDARKRTWYGFHTAKQDRARLQGAGSVKRDAQIWEDFLTDLGVDFEMVAPKNNATKLTAESFRKLTGWVGKTNEHGRDAAMLVYGF
jgi:hypothetical protein